MEKKKEQSDTHPTYCDFEQKDWNANYENLRNFSLNNNQATQMSCPRSLSLLMRKGVAGWMKALNQEPLLEPKAIQESHYNGDTPYEKENIIQVMGKIIYTHIKLNKNESIH